MSARPAPLTRLLCALLALTLLVSGCQLPQRPEGASAEMSLAVDNPDDALSGDGDGAEDVGRRERRAARIAAVSVVIGVLVIVDVLLLPAYHRRRNCFPCTRRVIVFVD